MNSFNAISYYFSWKAERNGAKSSNDGRYELEDLQMFLNDAVIEWQLIVTLN